MEKSLESRLKNCQKCDLCQAQKPLIDQISNKSVDVMWLGLSAKKTDDLFAAPLSSDTASGKILQKVEKSLSGVSFYKSNAVKCPPLDSTGKLRYPKKSEIETCYSQFQLEIQRLKPKIVFLLGKQVSEYIFQERKLGKIGVLSSDFCYEGVKNGETLFVPIHHPSYIHIYKQKNLEDFIKSLRKLIQEYVL